MRDRRPALARAVPGLVEETASLPNRYSRPYIKSMSDVAVGGPLTVGAGRGRGHRADPRQEARKVERWGEVVRQTTEASEGPASSHLPSWANNGAQARCSLARDGADALAQRCLTCGTMVQ